MNRFAKAAELCAIALCAFTISTRAGEPGPAPRPAEAEKKPPQQEDIFIFDPGERRDPFSFIKEIPKDTRITGPEGNSGDNTEKIMNAAEIAAKKMEAMTHYNLAEQSMLENNAPDSMAHCDKGLEVFKDVPMKDYKELQEVRDLLMRLRKAAERIKQRQDAERDFQNMNLKLTGVVAREKNSRAIINARIVEKGMVVPATPDGVDVVVAEILPQKVVFVFRGYKMMLELSDSTFK